MNSFNLLKEQAKILLGGDSGGHDYYHLERVFNTSLKLQQSEGGDELIIGCSAIVHDLCRPWEKEMGKSHFGPEALEIIRTVLQKVDLNEEQIEAILEIVKEHDVYDWTEKNLNKSIELQIVQDADNLDAIGAIGIGRTFAFGGSHNLLMWIPDEKLIFKKDFEENMKYTTNTIAHFYEKLLKLKDNMNTKTGKSMALQRHEYMEDFLEQFFAEWKGER